VCVLLKVKVTLRLTVNQSVCLGVEPRLGLESCFKVTVLSMWAPSLTRGRVCHLSAIVNSIRQLSVVQIFINLQFLTNCMWNIYIQGLCVLLQILLQLRNLLTYIADARTQTHSKHITWSLSNQYTGASVGSTEDTTSSIVACWTVFTELLPGNALIKSVTI
jgi:hypothetical protein